MSDSTGEDPKKPSTIGRLIRKFVNALFLLCIAVLLCLGGCNTVTKKLAKRYDTAQPRSAETGVLVGAEPYDVGPEDAEKAVLFVHGFVGGSNNFRQVPQMLADQGVHARIMRLPGHGTTPFELAETPPGDFSLAVLRELRDLKKDHDKVYLAGHSMGSSLCVLAASMEEVDGVILGAPYFGVTQQWYYIFPVEFWSRITGPLIHRVYKGNAFLRVKDPEAKKEILSYRWIPSEGTRILRHIGDRASDPDILESVDAPLLLMHGVDDFAASPTEAEKAFSHIASEDKTLLWLENSDHHIYWDYDRDQVAQAVLDFIAAH